MERVHILLNFTEVEIIPQGELNKNYVGETANFVFNKSLHYDVGHIGKYQCKHLIYSLGIMYCILKKKMRKAPDSISARMLSVLKFLNNNTDIIIKQLTEITALRNN